MNVDVLRRRAGGCYRVLVVSMTRIPALPWTRDGGDQRYEDKLRRAAIIVNALDEEDAAKRAAVVGRQIMGGRSVRVESVEQKCLPGVHNGELTSRVRLPFFRLPMRAAA